MVKNAKQFIEEIVNLADVQINGNRPWDIQVHNERFYNRILADGVLGFGEAYMDGWWDCKVVDELVAKLVKTDADKKVKKSLYEILTVIKSKLFNLQSKSKAYEIGKKHYNKGNELFKAMLDKRMNYSCGYWKNAKNLDEAQEAKLDLICRKIGLKPGERVLDIGCGWGSFLKYAAEKYDAKGVGITVSKEQVELGRKECKGLPVEIKLQDYRDLKEKFDHVISVGMIEHVGPKNYRKYMKIVHNCLKSDDSLFLLHTIGENISTNSINSWMNKYIFPNGVLPSAKRIIAATKGLFVLEDWHNFGAYYDKTLMAWHDNFTKNWDKIKKSYNERFYKMWTFYLLSAAGSFRARKNQLWQIVLSKKGVKKSYENVR